MSKPPVALPDDHDYVLLRILAFYREYPHAKLVSRAVAQIESRAQAPQDAALFPVVTGGHAAVIQHEQSPRYLSYYFHTPDFFAQKKRARARPKKKRSTTIWCSRSN